jgi:signal transduction histidine kinase
VTTSPRTAAFATLPRNGLYTVLYNTAIAALLTGIGFGGSFAVNFVYSQCIGLSIWVITDVSCRLLWPSARPPILAFVALLCVSVPIAWLAGTWLAALVSGHPWRVHGYLASLLVTAAAGVIGGFYFWEREKLAQLEAQATLDRSRAETVERQVAEARLKLLQSQIEPHFLFNTLANLHALISADPVRAQRMLDHLNDFLRAALAASRKDRTTLADEFALLRDYLEILAIRMGPRLEFRLDLPDTLAGAKLPPMLLQPLVENAVKHGIEPKVEGGAVEVSARAADGHLAIAVADTGVGLGAAATAGTRAGLAHVRERLGAVYGRAASLEIADNSPGGVVATLRLPLER